MYVYREIYIFDYLTYIHGKKVYICRGGGGGVMTDWVLKKLSNSNLSNHILVLSTTNAISS